MGFCCEGCRFAAVCKSQWFKCGTGGIRDSEGKCQGVSTRGRGPQSGTQYCRELRVCLMISIRFIQKYKLPI